MKTFFHKQFDKQFMKLSAQKKSAVDRAIDIFRKDPCNKILKNHKLKGSQKGRRAISAGGDLRIVFEERDGYVLVLFLSVGSHNQVY